MRASETGRLSRALAVALVVVLALAASSCAAERAVDGRAEPSAPSESISPREKVIHDFVIPAGTSARIARGEDVGIIPSRLRARVGDKIRVRNEDTELMRLGIFDVQPGGTVTMNFNTPGQMEGVIFADEAGGCGVPPGEAKTFVIDVKA